MGPTKPVEAVTANTGSSHDLALASVLRQLYWRERAQETPPPPKGDATTGARGQRDGQPSQAVQPPTEHRRTYAEFEVSGEENSIIVRIIDADSGEVLRTIPPNELAQEIASGTFNPARMRRLIIG